MQTEITILFPWWAWVLIGLLVMGSIILKWALARYELRRSRLRHYDALTKIENEYAEIERGLDATNGTHPKN